VLARYHLKGVAAQGLDRDGKCNNQMKCESRLVKEVVKKSGVIVQDFVQKHFAS
jgi:hypothetical protein